jgi:hypothetical protein
MIVTNVTARALIAAAVVAAGISGCGSDQPAVCASVDALTASVGHLKDVKIGENGLSGLESTLTQIKKDVTQVKNDAKQQYGPEITRVQSSVDAVAAGVTAARDDPSATTFAAVGSAVVEVGTGVQALAQSVSGTC